MSKLCSLVEGQTQTVSGQHVRVADLLYVKSSGVRSVSTALLSESEGPVCYAICIVGD